MIPIAQVLAAIYGLSACLSLLISDYSLGLSLRLDHAFHFWTWASYPCVERSWLSLLLSAPSLFFTLRYFERLWGPRQLLYFVAFVTVVAALAWLTLMTMASILFLSASDTPSVQGLSAFFSAIVVAYKQYIPAHRIDLKFFSFPVKYLPMAWITFFFILALFGMERFHTFVMLLVGFLVAWIYLRFIKYEDGLRGDRSETFAFVTFFPEPLHPVLRPISNSVFRSLVKLKVLKPMQPPLDMELGFSLAGRPRRFLATAPKPMPVTGLAALESERRKALALKAVEDRLKQKSNKS